MESEELAMNKILSLMLSIAMIIYITAYSSCGGSDDDDASFSQSVTIPQKVQVY